MANSLCSVLEERYLVPDCDVGNISLHISTRDQCQSIIINLGFLSSLLGLFAARLFFILRGRLSFSLPAQTPTVSEGALCQDAPAPLDARVQDMLHRMAIEEKIGQLVNHAPAILRLGIPEYDWWNEALHGVARTGAATVFPQALGLEASGKPC